MRTAYKTPFYRRFQFKLVIRTYNQMAYFSASMVIADMMQKV